MNILSTPPLPFHPSSHEIWYPSTTSSAFTLAPTPTTPSTTNANPNQQTLQQQQAAASRSRPTTRTFLTHLRSDENAILLRRANIRRFGAGWLKPPGIAKTMQGIWDERAEREEAELVAMREAGLQAEHAAAQLLAQADAEAAAAAGGEAAEGERDLDDEIPEAEAEGEWLSSDDEDEDEDEEGLPMNEVDGDFGPDGARMDVIGDGAGDEPDRDLDDDVPEAGSYQHTDTDVEDSSSVVEGVTDLGLGRRRSGLASVTGFAGLSSSPGAGPGGRH